MEQVDQDESRPSAAEIRRLLEELQLVPNSSADNWSTNPVAPTHDDPYELAIRQFQQERGLVANGVVDPDTHLELIGARYQLGNRPLKHLQPVMRGDDVYQLQHQLAELGFHHGNLDGLFGPTSASSVRSFQSDYGLTIDGVCGTETAGALHNLLPKVTGGSASVLVSQAHRRTTGPDLAGRYIVLDPARPRNPDALDFLNQVTTRVRYQLELLGANAILSQGQHERLSGHERSTRANDVDAEIYLSLDVASHESPHVEGVATYYFGSPSGASQVGRELAGLLQREISARTGFTDLGEHPRVLETLRATRMPSIHVELGYLSNETDRARMSDARVRHAITNAVVAAIQRFYLVSAEDHQTGTWQVPKVSSE